MTKMNKLGACCLLLVSLSVDAAPAPPWRALEASYRCEAGEVLEVSFLNQRRGENFAVLVWQGKPVLMRQLRAASGFRYADVDEQRGLRLYGKGREARVMQMPADDSAREQTLLDGCTAGD